MKIIALLSLLVVIVCMAKQICQIKRSLFNILQHPPTWLIGGSIAFALLAGCKEKTSPPIESHNIVIDSTFSMLTTDVNTLISDSGLTQYRMIAKKWFIYDRSKPPYWYFPEGFYAEKFDENDQAVAFVKADTARYNLSNEEWILWGNVQVINLQGHKFYAQKLYWNRSQREVYSLDTVLIITPERKLHAANFKGNDMFTEYSFYNTQGTVDVKDEDAQ